jgi:hypothetical protein
MKLSQPHSLLNKTGNDCEITAGKLAYLKKKAAKKACRGIEQEVQAR